MTLHHDVVHPTGGNLRVFKHFPWLEVGSGKMALPPPAHQRVTHTVRRENIDVRSEQGYKIGRLSLLVGGKSRIVAQGEFI